jgi:hypothetical protein
VTEPTKCPICGENNNPEFQECWKCHCSFSQGMSVKIVKIQDPNVKNGLRRMSQLCNLYLIMLISLFILLVFWSSIGKPKAFEYVFVLYVLALVGINVKLTRFTKCPYCSKRFYSWWMGGWRGSVFNTKCNYCGINFEGEVPQQVEGKKE